MIHGTKIFATIEFAWTMALIGIVFPVGLLLFYLLITDRRKKPTQNARKSDRRFTSRYSFAMAHHGSDLEHSQRRIPRFPLWRCLSTRDSTIGTRRESGY
jgi:hypothetical protein